MWAARQAYVNKSQCAFTRFSELVDKGNKINKIDGVGKQAHFLRKWAGEAESSYAEFRANPFENALHKPDY